MKRVELLNVNSAWLQCMHIRQASSELSREKKLFGNDYSADQHVWKNFRELIIQFPL